jgi:hypothetical protein
MRAHAPTSFEYLHNDLKILRLFKKRNVQSDRDYAIKIMRRNYPSFSCINHFAGELLKERIGKILRPLTASAAIRFIAATALLMFAPSAFPSRSVFAQEQNTAAQPDPEFLAKKAAIFKQFNIREAKPGEYPITMLPSDRVLPVMHDVTDVGDIAWLDNDTIIYVPQTGLTAQEVFKNPGSLWLTSLNLKTLEAKRIVTASADHFCYDHETHNIRFVGVSGDGADKQRPIVYGKLGGHLDTFVPPPRITGRQAAYVHQPSSYTNHLDCTFYPQVPAPGALGRTFIRTADGNLGLQHDANGQNIPAAYILTNADGTVKTFNLGSSNLPLFHYDYFSKLYWHYEYTNRQVGPSDGIKVWRLNKHLDVVSEEFYRHGPWGNGYPPTSVAPGFIMSGAMYGGVLTSKTKIHDLTYLTTKTGTITEIAEDELGAAFSVSPDGCKAATVRYAPVDHGSASPTGEIAIINVCKK